LKNYIFYLIIICGIFFFLLNEDVSSSKLINKKDSINNNFFNEMVIKRSLPSYQMYFYIKKYAEIYDVPLKIAFNIAKYETGYRGPSHFNYNHRQISYANAIGAMQIILSTGNFMSDTTLTKKDLLENIELNIEISMKYLRYLYDIKKDWHLACGFYNTGYWVVNDYSRKVVNENKL